MFSIKGLDKYKQILKIFRNIGTDTLAEHRLNLYYAFHMIILIPKVFEKLSMVLEIESLHAATFIYNPITLRNYKNTLWDFP